MLVISRNGFKTKKKSLDAVFFYYKSLIFQVARLGTNGAKE